jgi:hypothetical protein
MKLKEFNAENTINQRADKPSIHINTKTGLFNFNKAACDLISLGDEDKITFHQDQEEPFDWYLEKVKTEKGFTLRTKDDVTKGVLLNNVTLARTIVHSISSTIISGRVPIAAEPTAIGKIKLWPLLTIALNNQ